MTSVKAEICEKIQPLDEDSAITMLLTRIEEVLEHDYQDTAESREIFLRVLLSHGDKKPALKEGLANSLTWLSVGAGIAPLPSLERRRTEVSRIEEGTCNCVGCSPTTGRDRAKSS